MLAAAFPKDEPRAFGAARRGSKRLPKPRMLVAEMVGDDVDGDPHAAGVHGLDQPVEVCQGPEHRVHVTGVRDVVPAVGHRRSVERAEPQRVHPEVGQEAQPRCQARQVADAVAVPVGEAPGIDLIEDRRSPPRRVNVRRGNSTHPVTSSVIVGVASACRGRPGKTVRDGRLRSYPGVLRSESAAAVK